VLTCYSPIILGFGVNTMRRREFITLLGGGMAAWPLAAPAQQATMAIVGLVSGRSLDSAGRAAAAFRKGLGETGFVKGQNVTVEYNWLGDRYDRLPEIMADLVRRRVAVIATPGSNPAALAESGFMSTRACKFIVLVWFGFEVPTRACGHMVGTSNPPH